MFLHEMVVYKSTINCKNLYQNSYNFFKKKSQLVWKRKIAAHAEDK